VAPSPAPSPAAPLASSCPLSSTIETRCAFMPLTAEATMWRMARTCCGSSAPRTRSTMEADGSGVSRENSGRSEHQMHARRLDALDRLDCGRARLQRARG